jgi:ABC-type nitrate/sulfonate/bicarbonate transport system ATPase subunit
VATKLLVREVWKAYGSGEDAVSALEAVDLTVTEGEFIAIVGPSGCGKSTLLNILAGFERPDRGEALVDGQPIAGPGRKGLLITQRGSVFPWMTVRRNLEFGAEHLPATERDELIRYYLELCRLSGFEDVYPYQLSGGMMQRVEVARALMAKPDILYMDEPFGALDALTRLRMRTELLVILNRDRHTSLLVTHDVEEALHLADRIVVMTPRPGRIKRVLEVPVQHPRALANPMLLRLKKQVLQELGLSVEDIEHDTVRVQPTDLAKTRDAEVTIAGGRSGQLSARDLSEPCGHPSLHH